MSKIAIIGCTKKKRDSACCAKDLYSASNLFRKEYEYAVRIIGADEIYILSAKHHLISADTVIEPYDVTLLTMRKAERKEWSRISIEQIKEKTNSQNDTLYFFCGSKYYEFLEKDLIEMGYAYEIPLKGKGGIGKQMQWLAEQLT